MNMCIIYANINGGVSIITPSSSSNMTIEQIVAKDVPAGVDYCIVNASEIPLDRTFRDAWEKSGKSITHNMVKCRDIVHVKRRAARAAAFAPLDIEATIPAKAAAAEAKRQAIRDADAALQVKIDAAPTVDALKVLLDEL